jgi:RNA polymerase sigma-70 factor (ECF subfamily)
MERTEAPDHSSLSDETLAKLVQGTPHGDLRAFELLVQRHKGHITANCRHITGEADESEDLAQDVFVKAFFGISQFEGRAKFRTWLQRIKINHCLNHIRKRKRKHFVEVDDPSVEGSPALRAEGNPERDLMRLSQKQKVRRVLEMMRDSLRVPLIMSDMDGLSYKEIAESLNLGLSATKMRIKRAREEFRRLFKDATEALPADAGSGVRFE